MPPSGRKPRLAYLFSRYPVISQTFVDNEILGLEAAGWEVVVCSLHPPHNDLRHPRLNELRAPVFYAPPQEVRKGMAAHWRGAGRWPAEFVKEHAGKFGDETRPEVSCGNVFYFAGLLPALGVDHVHIHFANRATHAALFLKEIAGIPFSFTPQAQDFLIDVHSPELLGEMCRQAEFVITACDWAKAELLKLCPDAAGKVRRIYNGIDPSPYPQACPSPAINTLKVASVGRLIEFKGFHHLIAAIGKARAQGVTVRLDLMGDGPWRGVLETQVAGLRLEEQVKFHGSVTIDQMRECYARVDAFALACIEDAKGAMDVFPTVITEAMLSSLPVVSSRIAGVPEQVIDGVTGFVTAPGDEDALDLALRRLATEPGLALNFGKAGRQRALELFSIHNTLPMLEEEFQKMRGGGLKWSKPRATAFYDLGAPGCCRLLETEIEVLRGLGAHVWLAGGAVTKKDAERFTPCFQGAFWLPDPIALEMEWRSRSEERAALEKLRADLSAPVDDARFATAARHALWISVQSRRLGLPELFYAPGEPEALVIWLTSKLTGVPFVLATDSASESGEALQTPRLDRSRPRTNAPPRGILKRLRWLLRWQTRRRQTQLRDWLQKTLPR